MRELQGMGIYLNPGNTNFWKSIRSEIYVDKTELIAYTNQCINTMKQYICVSRPRRFGKSMTLEMLAAYYSRGCDSRELFKGFKIIELRKAYGKFFPKGEKRLAAALEQIYAETGRQFIFLIDEWDCVMRERQKAEELQRQYLDFLRDLLKDQPYVALAYMTGILPVKKYGSHSALNMFWEYSMTDQKELEEYTGFTEAEVKGLCERLAWILPTQAAGMTGIGLRDTGISTIQGRWWERCPVKAFPITGYPQRPMRH